MHAHPKRMILAEHLAKFRSDPLRQKNGNACADAQKLKMRNRAQSSKDVLEPLIREQQGIAAREKHITDTGVFFQIAEWRAGVRGGGASGAKVFGRRAVRDRYGIFYIISSFE